MAQATQHPIPQKNTSLQMQHSFHFAKTKRFPESHAQCPQAFYAIQPQVSPRRAHIGYGSKSDFTKTLTVSPPSTKYNHKSVFEQTKNGKSFACSRDKVCPVNSYLMPHLYKNPGPGQYDNRVHTRMHQTFSIDPKKDSVLSNRIVGKQSPGPAVYEQTDNQNVTGRYFVSKYRNVKLATIDPYMPRFLPIQNKSPGPSNYNQEDYKGDKTKYFLSNYQGKGNRPFDREARFTFSHCKTDENPGPGNYQIKSAFDAENAKKSFHF